MASCEKPAPSRGGSLLGYTLAPRENQLVPSVYSSAEVGAAPDARDSVVAPLMVSEPDRAIVTALVVPVDRTM